MSNNNSEVNAAIEIVDNSTSTAVAVLEKPAHLHPQISFQDAQNLAKHLANSTFVPKSFRGQEGDVLAACLIGNEIGLGPIQSLQSLYAIDGKIVMAADKQLALFLRYGGQIKWHQLDDTCAKITGTWKGATSTVMWNIERAKAAKLTHKDNWSKYPKAMLRSRAVTELLKDIGFEPTSGMYDPEELDAEPIIPAPAPSVEDLENVAAGIVELIQLNADRGKKSLSFFVSNSVNITNNRDECKKFADLLTKTIASEKKKSAVTSPAEVVSVQEKADDESTPDFEIISEEAVPVSQGKGNSELLSRVKASTKAAETNQAAA